MLIPDITVVTIKKPRPENTFDSGEYLCYNVSEILQMTMIPITMNIREKGAGVKERGL